MSRRHADVDDRQIRLTLTNQPHQLGPVTGLADYLVPTLLEQARETLAHENVILGDDHSRAALSFLGHRESMPQE
jgi:hypothetical protein